MSRRRVVQCLVLALVSPLGVVVGPSVLAQSSGLDPRCDEPGVILGTEGDDVLEGTNSADVICGLGGNDVIWGRGGSDVLLGGGGHDRLYGGQGSDVLEGGAGDDRVEDWSGLTRADLGDGDDVFIGFKPESGGNGGVCKEVSCTPVDEDPGGGDELVFESGSAVVEGGPGADVIGGGQGADWLSGGPGDDEIFGGNHDDRLLGGAGDDLLNGEAHLDRIVGGDGADVMRGGDGDDVLIGGRGIDVGDGGTKVDACSAESVTACESEAEGVDGFVSELPVLPVPGSWSVQLARFPRELGDSGVWLSAGDDAAIGQHVDVELLSGVSAFEVGFDGVGLVMVPAGDAPAALQVEVGVDVSAYRQLFGGDWLTRLGGGFVDGCVQGAAGWSCTGAASGVVSSLDGVRDRVVFTATAGEVAAASAGAGGVSPQADGFVSQDAGGGGVVWGLLAGVRGSAGDFGETGLSPSAEWSQGGSSGGFSWSYPLSGPDVGVGGPLPGFGLGYSSQSVDGLTSNTNAQASPAGLGWGLSGEAFVERSYASCTSMTSGPRSAPTSRPTRRRGCGSWLTRTAM